MGDRRQSREDLGAPSGVSEDDVSELASAAAVLARAPLAHVLALLAGAAEGPRLPTYVHQRSVETILGYPGRDYLRAAHDGAFPTTKERRLIIARTADVTRWLELRLTHRGQKPANDADAETMTLARVGARRVAR